jgi:thymidine kinase
MAKLYFRYGVVGSAKTLNLLAVAHNYRRQGKGVLLAKPAVDTRYGERTIGTRAGLSAEADLVISDCPFDLPTEGISCVLVDEAQFLPASAVDRLHGIAHSDPGLPVICYGLRTDFRTEMFPASRRLMELADSIEEVKTTCHYCDRKAVFNLKVVGGRPSLDGPAVELGFEERYLPACASCYLSRLGPLISPQK